ncbi:nitrate- and nitrite sensing domain-containing protein [Haloechinothrix sp. LS1_15]|uniref:sensor histidine kinase n=1 Tax=Haloechinothrix sp. LS1_15 TaxID=2652248 RepID=UPI002947B7D1|nr:nitrate- and nitrite sensing domain-containing protein [Haloechinothrix sp. LS1_15]MDV6012915.1 sensor histidine kinase [Haloechinothrix sp. LS1_15]
MADTGQQQVPVEKLLGQAPQRPASRRQWLDRLVQWRDWTLPVKLAAVTIVPILIAVALGASTLSNQRDQVNHHERTAELVQLSGEVGRLMSEVHSERTATVSALARGSADEDPVAEAQAAVDEQLAPVRDAAGAVSGVDGGMSSAVRDAENALGRLGELRDELDAGQLSPVQALAEYTALSDALAELDAAAVARIPDEEIGGTSRAVGELRAAAAAASYQQALIAYGIDSGALVPSELSQARTAEVRIADRLAGFEAAATPEQRQQFDAMVSGPSFATRERLADAALGDLGTPSEMAIQQLSLDEWTSSSSRIVNQLGTVAAELHGDAADRAAAQVSEARSGVIVLGALLGLAFALALLVVFAITRHLLRSLRQLRSSAMHVAESRLPEAVREIQESNGDVVEITPVPVHSRDEAGELARAFDAVHRQALRLAAEQASMRNAYNSVFVNLSRRSQSLVQRQLQLIEQLERDEEDADQLATLFHLDHLATRMRRNNENLMVLSGSESGRRSGRPVSTADVLRAAVSEIEQYQRVVVQSPPTTKIVGHAASDLMRLLAELLDNATAFSPPETQVTVASCVLDSGAMSIDVLDNGIGMNAEEVVAANARMQASSPVDLVTSRRMGLFVVGRLASKHGFSVTLHGGKESEGVRACVAVPSQLVIGAGGGPLTAEMPAIGDGDGASEHAELPRRRPGASGAGTAALGAADTTSSPRVNGTPPACGATVPGKPQVETSGGGLFTPVAGQDGDTGPVGSPQVNGARWQQNGDRETGGTSGAGVAGNGAGSDALPAGEELFRPGTAPLSDWWNSTAAEAQQSRPAEPTTRSRPETTPIFDEMLSVWFRDSGQDSGDGAPDGAEGALSTWDFAADVNWRAVREVTGAAPSSYTEAGLPRRNRGEQLLPGSAIPVNPANPEAGEQAEQVPSRSAMGRAELPSRDPQDVRGKLSNFQRGLSKGRAERHQRRDAPGEAAGGTAPQAAASSSAPAQPEGQGAAAPGAASEVTESGLPRRRRGEQLVPGSIGGAVGGRHSTPESQATQPERDPNAMRGRLSSFQQGIRRGRNSVAQPGENGSQPREPEAADERHATERTR